MPTRKELIGANMTVPQIEKYLEVDSLRYLSSTECSACRRFPTQHFATAVFRQVSDQVPPINGKYSLGVISAMVGLVPQLAMGSVHTIFVFHDSAASVPAFVPFDLS